MTYSLKVISSRLLVANVGVDTSVSCSPSKVLALSEWDVLTIGILKALSKAEVDNEDIVFVMLRASHQEVVRLDVSMNDPFFMHFLNSHNLLIIRPQEFYHLDCYLKH